VAPRSLAIYRARYGNHNAWALDDARRERLLVPALRDDVMRTERFVERHYPEW